MPIKRARLQTIRSPCRSTEHPAGSVTSRAKLRIMGGLCPLYACAVALRAFARRGVYFKARFAFAGGANACVMQAKAAATCADG
jgi:hypothetical protein